MCVQRMTIRFVRRIQPSPLRLSLNICHHTHASSEFNLRRAKGPFRLREVASQSRSSKAALIPGFAGARSAVFVHGRCHPGLIDVFCSLLSTLLW
jgi:hypothetical protein